MVGRNVGLAAFALVGTRLVPMAGPTDSMDLVIGLIAGGLFVLLYVSATMLGALITQRNRIITLGRTLT